MKQFLNYLIFPWALAFTEVSLAAEYRPYQGPGRLTDLHRLRTEFQPGDIFILDHSDGVETFVLQKRLGEGDFGQDGRLKSAATRHGKHPSLPLYVFLPPRAPQV